MFLYDVNKILNYIEFRMNIKFMFEIKKKFYSKNYVERSESFTVREIQKFTSKFQFQFN